MRKLMARFWNGILGRRFVPVALAVIFTLCVALTLGMAYGQPTSALWVGMDGVERGVGAPVAQAPCTGSDCIYLPVISGGSGVQASPTATGVFEITATRTPTRTPAPQQSKTPTSTRTPTSTPTRTSTPTPTPTVPPGGSIPPTPTPTPLPPLANVQFESLYIDAKPAADWTYEYAIMKNRGSTPVTMTGWTLRNSSHPEQKFSFPAFELQPGATVKVWVQPGTNTATDLYWGLMVEVWNDIEDTAVLRDQFGRIVAQCDYKNPPERIVYCS
ncbi:MAG: lamin tail domain-containing protein [Caldilineaceae bacterium]|nr:lamin tail domain-containing protein [Caldilineaceae bacterium]